MTLIFLHIPKTAGTTFNYVLYKHFSRPGNMACRVNYGEPPGKWFTKAGKNKLSLISAHGRYGLHRPFGEIDYKYITMLRHPVERVLSLYNFIKLPINKYHYWHRTAIEMPLEKFLEECPEMGEEQTRCIAGVPYGTKITIAEYLKAKTNLDKEFVFVGIVDQFDESLVALKHCMGWDDLDFYTRKNVHSTKPHTNDVTEDVYQRILNMNCFDNRLYKYYKNVLALYIVDNKLQAEVVEYQEANANYEHNPKMPYDIPAAAWGILQW